MVDEAELAKQELPAPLHHYLRMYGRWPHPEWGLTLRGWSGLGAESLVWVPDHTDALNDDVVRFGEGANGVPQYATYRSGDDPEVLFNDGPAEATPPYWRVASPSLRKFLIQNRFQAMAPLGLRCQLPSDQQAELALHLLDDADLLFETEGTDEDPAESMFVSDDVLIWDVAAHAFERHRPAVTRLYVRDAETYQRHFGDLPPKDEWML